MTNELIMEHEKINRTIAEWMGCIHEWEIEDEANRRVYWTCLKCGASEETSEDPPPVISDYCSSLDAIAPVEARAIEVFGTEACYRALSSIFREEGWDPEDRFQHGMHFTLATAEQRASAIESLIREGR